MKNLAHFLDSTYLKTTEQAGISEEETLKNVKKLVDDALSNRIFAVMIRPEYVSEIKNYIAEKNTDLIIGTVIGFHEGTATVDAKLEEAEKAIHDGADELDFVINFREYLKGNTDYVHDEFLKCTYLCLKNQKTIKWIIETAALSDMQIADLSQKISTWAEENFSENDLSKIFVKSSTGFFKTENGKPNGATFENIKIMIANAGKLPVKAAGGIKSREDAEKMISLGIQRIGTSSAESLINGQEINRKY